MRILIRQTKGKKWHKDDLRVLRVIRCYMPLSRIADITGRSVKAVQAKLLDIDSGKIKF